MECRLCDYFKIIGYSKSGKEISKCNFTNTLFGDNVENIDINYPCSNVNNQIENAIYNHKAVKTRNLSIYENNDWKYLYRSVHPVYKIN